MSVDRIQRAVVIGDGSWGTALALVLAKNGVDTTLWSARPERSALLAKERVNTRYLPGVPFPDTLRLSPDPHSAAEGVDLAVSAVPTQFVGQVAARFEDALPGTATVVSASKGLEIETFRTPSEILQGVLGERPVCVLTGPSHAEEVARGLPASLVAGCADGGCARLVQDAFNCDTFRVYTCDDARGAELAAALKNVIAIAAGIGDGLGLGDNAKSALITRGIAEMARFGRVRGARVETFFGLAGLGDLVTTCTSRHSRNRRVGEAIGAGRTLQQVLDELDMVAEGVWTTKALFGPESLGDPIEMPIAEQVHAVLFEDKDPRAAVTDLMRREPTAEMHGLFDGGRA
ncbi:MAG: NAD(P)H-dependent glycerol-3-phosphate dehydrogenase [Planctomycetota bacterium]